MFAGFPADEIRKSSGRSKVLPVSSKIMFMNLLLSNEGIISLSIWENLI